MTPITSCSQTHFIFTSGSLSSVFLFHFIWYESITILENLILI